MYRPPGRYKAIEDRPGAIIADDKPMASFLPAQDPHIEIVLNMCEQLFSHGGDAFDIDRHRLALSELIREPRFGGAWLIQLSGETAGHFVLTVCYSLEFAGSFGLLDELYLMEAWRAAGLGTEALAFAEDECRRRGLQALRLEVGHTNARALALYAGRGFRAEDRH